MSLKALSSGLVESILNRYLQLDDDAELLLAPVQGKVIGICLEPFQQILYLCPAKDRIQVLDEYPDGADVTIYGSLPALGVMGLQDFSLQSVFNGDVRIEGDIRTGHKFQAIFQNLDIDWEEHLSHWTGDVIAHQIGNLTRFGRQWAHQAVDTLILNSQEYLQEEIRELPAVPEAEIFFNRVDHLRADFDRLQARIDRLETRLTGILSDDHSE